MLSQYFFRFQFGFWQKITLLVASIFFITSLPGMYIFTELKRGTSIPEEKSSRNHKKTTESTLSSRALIKTLSEVEPVKRPESSSLPKTNFTLSQPSKKDGININEAPVSILKMLPGIGPKTAEDIAQYRQKHGPFSSLQSLDKVPGIGPATIEDFKEKATY